MRLDIPIKNNRKVGEVLFNHQVRLNSDKTEKLARVREILGGYSTAELLEILIDSAIDNYYDGKEVKDLNMLPRNFYNN